MVLRHHKALAELFVAEKLKDHRLKPGDRRTLPIELLPILAESILQTLETFDERRKIQQHILVHSPGREHESQQIWIRMRAAEVN